jgi:FeS assembly SUF system regulator
MLKLSKKADYGLIAIRHLAVRANDAGSASAKEIAACYGISASLLSKILQTLTRAGMLHSEHGTNGGYRLARDPRSITALEIIQAIDGPVFLTSCFTQSGECDHSSKCNVREPLRKVHEGILGLLGSITMTEESEQAPPDEKLYAVAAQAHKT